MAQDTVTHSTLTCPECGHATLQEMPTDACLFFFTCPSCAAQLRPLAGDCCVFCSYGDTPCPPIQAGGACGC
ncbi:MULTISPECIES: GDCCVxC domain-containing (seleno)protein [Sediminimonas]|uniref:GDCCVxC domain-containing (seleno)protein n=1 Tax=Sediminimonas TaxID=659427 RepID=UPI000428A950|nr:MULTISPECIES: GDCCVxC domain-containing (seleno)protein [Sediminimonas]MDR9485982.1 GDCCVxC domain-containing (seleno)protein [Sediminimonas sp.]